MKNKLLVGILLTALSGAANATPITIDFDDLGSGVTVGSHYSALGVTFVDAVTAGLGSLPGGTPPTTIIHTAGVTPQPSDPIEAIFSSLVSSVSLTGIDVGLNGFILSAYDAISGGSLIGSTSVFGSNAGVGEFYTLSLSTVGIRRVEFSQVRNVAGDGVTFDNFVFDTTSVPLTFTIAPIG